MIKNERANIDGYAGEISHKFVSIFFVFFFCIVHEISIINFMVHYLHVDKLIFRLFVLNLGSSILKTPR